MKVYIVIGYESMGMDILRVFDTEDKAKSYIAKEDNDETILYSYVSYRERDLQ